VKYDVYSVKMMRRKFFPCPSKTPEEINQIVLGEITKLPKELREKKTAYFCYVLRSVVAPARTYVGSTNDLVKRLREHNGIIKGGARATSTNKPWKVAMVVYGFTSWSATLRFEFFTKMKHSLAAYKKATDQGSDSIQRRGVLMCEGFKKSPEECLNCYFADPYMKECFENAMERYKKQAEVKKTLPDYFPGSERPPEGVSFVQCLPLPLEEEASALP